MTVKEEIELILRTSTRPGMDKVIDYLASTDFYTAPASAVMKYHNCFEGGLADHSLKVYNTMMAMNRGIPEEKRFHQQSIAVVGTLHDVCKIGVYQPNILKTTMRLSEEKPYKFDDKFQLGHGEKSLAVLLCLGLELSEEEQLAIRWHMNAFDAVPHSRCGESWNNLSILCFLADYFSTKFLEKAVEAPK